MKRFTIYMWKNLKICGCLDKPHSSDQKLHFFLIATHRSLMDNSLRFCDKTCYSKNSLPDIIFKGLYRNGRSCERFTFAFQAFAQQFVLGLRSFWQFLHLTSGSDFAVDEGIGLSNRQYLVVELLHDDGLP